jgi:hypothetical protein
MPTLVVPIPKPRTPAPALKTTGAAWPTVLASLSGYGQWVLANPNPALVATIATPGCSMYNLLSQQVAGLLNGQAYLTPTPPVFGTVVGPTAVPAALGNQVTVKVIASRPAEPVVGRNGRQFTQFQALPQTEMLITLDRGADGKWRFCSVNPWSDVGSPDDPSLPLL